MSEEAAAIGSDRMRRLIDELAYHADGNEGDGCWDLYDRYKPLLDAGAVLLLPGELPPWSTDSSTARHRSLH
jgi:hypothetical protein